MEQEVEKIFKYIIFYTFHLSRKKFSTHDLLLRYFKILCQILGFISTLGKKEKMYPNLHIFRSWHYGFCLQLVDNFSLEEACHIAVIHRSNLMRNFPF